MKVRVQHPRENDTANTQDDGSNPLQRLLMIDRCLSDIPLITDSDSSDTITCPRPACRISPRTFSIQY